MAVRSQPSGIQPVQTGLTDTLKCTLHQMAILHTNHMELENGVYGTEMEGAELHGMACNITTTETKKKKTQNMEVVWMINSPGC